MTRADRVHSTPPTNTPISQVDATSRRRFLSQAAGVAAGSAVLALATVSTTADAAAPVAALAPSGVDPILEAIEAHKAARATWLEWVYRHMDLEDELPEEKRRSNIDVWEEIIIVADDPRWIEAERESRRASDLETDAAVVLLNVQPTTQAGILALLKYAVEADTDGEGWPRDLISDGGKLRRSWHYFLIEGVAEALAGMVSVRAVA
jgi:hypothetical protein